MNTATTDLLSRSLEDSRLLAKGAGVVVVGAAALAIAGSWAQRSRGAALRTAVEGINEEVRAFIEAGGCLDGIRGVEAVIDALQLTGVNLEMQSEREASSSEVRATWDPRILSLTLQAGGESGVREINFSADFGQRPSASATQTHNENN